MLERCDTMTESSQRCQAVLPVRIRSEHHHIMPGHGDTRRPQYLHILTAKLVALLTSGEAAWMQLHTVFSVQMQKRNWTIVQYLQGAHGVCTGGTICRG